MKTKIVTVRPGAYNDTLKKQLLLDVKSPNEGYLINANVPYEGRYNVEVQMYGIHIDHPTINTKEVGEVVKILAILGSE